MNSIMKKLTGMDNMSHQVLATDLLMSTKSCVRNYAIALTVTASPEIRFVLRRHLNEAIVSNDNLTDYMVKNEYYIPYDVNEQINVDLTTTETALSLINGN